MEPLRRLLRRQVIGQAVDLVGDGDVGRGIGAVQAERPDRFDLIDRAVRRRQQAGHAADVAGDMKVTGLFRHVLLVERGGGHAAAAGVLGAPFARQQAAVHAVLHRDQIVGMIEGLGFLALQRAAHHLAPEIEGRVGGELLQALRGVVAEPHRADIIRRDAAEPAVVVGARRAGLAADVKAADRGALAGAVLDDAGQQLQHVLARALLHGGRRHRLVVQQQVAVGIINSRIEDRRRVLAVVDKGAVGGRHLHHRDALGQRTERQRADVDVAVRLGLAVLERLGHRIDQVGQAEVLGRPVVGALHADLADQIDRHGIERLGDAAEDRRLAAPLAVFVVGPALGAGGEVLRPVLNHRDRRDQPVFDGRAVNRDRLDGGAGAAIGLGGAVEDQVALLLAASAPEGQHMAGVGVHQHHGGLRIGAVVAQTAGEVVKVGKNRLHLVLDAGVDGGDDLQAAGIEQLLGRVGAVSLLGLQVGEHGIDDRVDKIALVFVLAVGGAAAVVAHRRDRLGHGLVILFLGDVVVAEHLLEHQLPALLVLLREAEQVVAVGVLDDSGQRGALGQRKLVKILVEVGLGRLAHAVGALPEVDGVEIELEDVVLLVFFLQLEGAHDLLDLALDGGLVLARQVFDELLGDGRAAAEVVPEMQDIVEPGADGALPVDAVVLIEGGVLDGDEGLLQLLGDVVEVHPDAVLATVQALKLDLFPGGRVRRIDEARQVEAIAVQIDVHVGADIFIDVYGKRHAADGRSGQADENNRHQHEQRIAGPLPEARPFLRIAQGGSPFKRKVHR